jgi:phosphosulfolactate phosphohydrolase-like enzyme
MVDALRASATITALIAAGARRAWVATEIEQAHAMKARLVQEGTGEPILLGEDEGFPPPGFRRWQQRAKRDGVTNKPGPCPPARGRGRPR